MAVSQSISLTQGAQSIENNTTQVTFQWTSTQSGESWNGYTRTAYYYVSINGGAETEYSVSYTLSKNTTQTIVSKIFTVAHNNDGTGSISIRTWMDTRISAGVVQKSASLTLTTIPRASSLSLSASSVNVESSITANISRASSSFTHNVEFYINDTYYQKYTGVSTSQSYTIPTSWYNAMPSSTSCTAYCRITTYNGSTQIGDQVNKSFTVAVPDSIVPSVGTVTLDPTDINNKNILVQNKNKITISVSGCSAGTGSSIKSYTFSGPGISKITTSTSESFGPISDTGTLSYKVTVTDNRGREASKTATITCYEYYAPSFTSFKAYRANSNGIANVNGTYLKCEYNTKFASVNSTNAISVKIYGIGDAKTASDGSLLINLNGDTTSSYQIYAKVTDSYGGSASSSTVTVFGETRALNITKDGTGFAIGKMAESNNLFECRWDAKFDGTASGPSGFSTSSDERVKKNIQANACGCPT